MGTNIRWYEGVNYGNASKATFGKNRYVNTAITALLFLLTTTKTVPHFGGGGGWNGRKVDDHVYGNTIDGHQK